MAYLTFNKNESNDYFENIINLDKKKKKYENILKKPYYKILSYFIYIIFLKKNTIKGSKQ